MAKRKRERPVASAISGTFWARPATPTSVTPKVKQAVRDHLAVGQSRGLSGEALRAHVRERMDFDHPSVPASWVAAAMKEIAEEVQS